MKISKTTTALLITAALALLASSAGAQQPCQAHSNVGLTPGYIPPSGTQPTPGHGGGPRVIGSPYRTGDFGAMCPALDKASALRARLDGSLCQLPGFMRTDLVRLSNGLFQVCAYFNAQQKQAMIAGGRMCLQNYLAAAESHFGVKDGCQLGVYWVGQDPVQRRPSGRGDFSPCR